MIENLDVYLWGRKVGALAAYRERYATKSCFYFDRDFASGQLDIAPLRASIKSEGIRRGMPVYADDDKIYGGLPSFVADSLPDYWGHRVFEQWAKASGIRLRDVGSLDRLAYLGRRGMGALEFVPPAAQEMESPFRVDIAELFALAQEATQEAEGFRATLGRDVMLTSLVKVGTSAGGRRPKAIIHVDPHTMMCYSGQVAAPEPGFVPMIIKFDEQGALPTTRIEYSYYLMARAAGLEMMPSRLVEEAGATHFLTERFDRCGGEKLHVQSLAAMQPGASSYEELLEVACRLEVTPAEVSRLFLSMVMNVLGGNVDDHNKNFAFLMGRDGVWHTAPAYDYTFAVDVEAPWYVNRHALTINGHDSDISRDDLLEVARRFNVKRSESLIEAAVEAVNNYPRFADEAGVDADWQRRIVKEQKRAIESL
jgi:serine/threonine-protein kinase HipA